MSIKLMIFDFDGTLYDKKNLITEIIDTKTAQFLAMYLDEELQQLELRMPNILQVLQTYKLDKEVYKNFVFGKINYSQYFKEDKNLIKLLSSVKCKRMVVSLSPMEYLKNAMAEINIGRYLDNIVSVCDMGDSYKKEEFVMMYLEHYGLNNDEVLCIGDSWINDLLGVHKMGIEVIKIGKDISVVDSKVKCFDDIYDCLKYCTDNYFS